MGIEPADIELVIATHYHHDHVGNIVALREEAPRVPFALYEDDVSAFLEAQHGMDRGGSLRAAGDQTDLTRVDVALVDGQRLRFGRAIFEVLHTPVTSAP